MSFVGAGYSLARTGSFILDDRDHPPLVKLLAGLSLLPLDLRLPSGDPSWVKAYSYKFGREFLYNNTEPPKRILLWARMPILLLSLLLGLGIYLWGLRLFGRAAALTGLALYSFEPTIVAHSSLVSLDMGVAAFGFFAIALYERFIATGKRFFFWASAATSILGLLSKVTAVLLPTALAAALALRASRGGRFAKDFLLWSGCVLALALMLLLAAGVGPRIVCRNLLYQLAQATGHAPEGLTTNFLRGETRPGGFLSYYLVALLVKTTLPFLILLGLSLARWRRGAAPGAWPWLAAPVALFLLVGSLSQKQFGLRYILPVIPFLCVAAGSFAARRLQASRRGPRLAAVLALLSLHAREALSVQPYPLAYFNQIAGGMDGGRRWLVGENLDWGEKLPLLRRYLLRQGSPETITALMTSGDLDYWIGPHQDLLPDPMAAKLPYAQENSLSPSRELLLVSASYQAGYGLSDPAALRWLDQLEPIAVLAGSILVYDVTRNSWAHHRLSRVYFGLGQAPLALRECRRSAELDPRNPAPYLAWADLYRAMGEPGEARRLYRRAARLRRP